MTTLRKPQTLGLEPSFGFGDRLGLATPGHLDALRAGGSGIAPIFAQQSIREMARTRRTADDVMRAACSALADEGFTGLWGADADHLKTEEDVEVTAEAGFVFFTIDPSDHVDFEADRYGADVLGERFDAVRGQVDWIDDYLGKTVRIDRGPDIAMDQPTVQRAAVKYGRAIEHAKTIAARVERVMGQRGDDYEIELSVDETPQPTTPAEHYIIANECLRAGMKLVSLAPRYIGDFEKGIDYKGDTEALARSLADHVAIARQLGPYKLSLHSGSDKLSIYALFARVTGGLFHVKTAGTSYLEALRVVARHDETLLRQIISFSRERFETDRATYHISARLDRVAPPVDVSDVRHLETLYLNEDDGRQILHVTFGSVLTDAKFGPAIHALLDAEPRTHREVLAEHFEKHLRALQQGM
ncbi:MAG: hypothetical protein IIA67_06855 [Planctomycetes bacterium]|nr:hypothetical protein [Planctomycetota bacterium]